MIHTSSSTRNLCSEMKMKIDLIGNFPHRTCDAASAMENRYDADIEKI